MPDSDPQNPATSIIDRAVSIHIQPKISYSNGLHFQMQLEIDVLFPNAVRNRSCFQMETGIDPIRLNRACSNALSVLKLKEQKKNFGEQKTLINIELNSLE